MTKGPRTRPIADVLDDVRNELTQYLEGSESFARAVMGGREGINHLSLRVDDIETSIRALEGAGIKTLEGFPTRGAHGKVAFFDAATTHDLLFEVCEPDRAVPRRGAGKRSPPASPPMSPSSPAAPSSSSAQAHPLRAR